MTNIYFIVFSILLFVSNIACGQSESKKVKIASIGFYNLENLFDTVDDTLINDSEFLPNGKRHWNQEKYLEKQANMAYTISQIGIQDVPAGLSVLGVSEIENRGVLEDLVNQKSIKNRNYHIIHHDSPDARGVDVALLYNPAHFQVLYDKAIPLINYENGERLFTRDILYVKGILELDTIHIMVNHWPSRGGGEARTAPFRNNGAKTCRLVADSIFALTPNAKVIVMGDLNDDPTDESIKSYLKATGKIKDVKKAKFFNPYEDMYRRGFGSNAYRDSWSLFDQIIISDGFIADRNKENYTYFKANIFNKQFLIEHSGQYKGYPKRTFNFDNYQGGYSDHFPSYIYLVKEIEN